MVPQPQNPRGDHSYLWIWGACYLRGGVLSAAFRGAEERIGRDTFGDAEEDARENHLGLFKMRHIILKKQYTQGKQYTVICVIITRIDNRIFRIGVRAANV